MIDEFSNRQGMHLTVIATLDNPIHKPVWLNLKPLAFTTKVAMLRTLVSGLLASDQVEGNREAQRA